MLVFTACGTNNSGQESDAATNSPQESTVSKDGGQQQNAPVKYEGVEIVLSDAGITVDGEAIASKDSSAVYVANDIVYYESGKDFTYGEGTEKDAHTADEAAVHTVVHIAEAGTYILSGTLSKGQIAVDLGKDAKKDPNAVVTLILNNVDITCEVAPAIIFYNVYECGDDDADKATKDVNTTAAGANVIIADGTTNTVHGSYVARIYKPDTVELNKAGTEVEDAKKLHKYDAAFYSKMSMDMNGGPQGTGILNIHAENEGLDSELHLTINSGHINIYSGNDGINTNEDGVSVTTINGGVLKIQVTGETGEGDGIDSNGWLVINGGTVMAAACSRSMDSGVDSDMGIHVNGGTLMAVGHMLDRIEDGGQTYAVFNFAQEQNGGQIVSLKDTEGTTIMEYLPQNDYSILVVSSADLKEGTYTLWSGETQMAGQAGGSMGGFGMPGGMRPEGGNPPEFPEGEFPQDWAPGELPEGWPEDFDGEFPEGFEGELPEGFNGEIPNGMQPPTGNQQPPQGGERPDGWGDFGGNQWRPGNDQGVSQESRAEFQIQPGGNNFSNVAAWKKTI